MSARMEITFAKGSKRVAFDVLSKVIEETKGFLSSMGEDLGDAGTWYAQNFRDGSVIFDLERPTEFDKTAELWRRGLRNVIGHQTDDEEMQVLISRATRIRYLRIAEVLPPNQDLDFGLYQNGEKSPLEFFKLKHAQAAIINIENPCRAPYYGEIQCVVHALYKEANPPKLVVRNLCDSRLVRCNFPAAMYQSAIEVLHDRHAVVFVEGDIHESGAGTILKIDAADFRLAPDFDEDWFESHIGAFPNAISGDLSPAEAVANYRSDEEAS